MVRLGYHISVAGGLVKAAQRAVAIGCECLQIFARNARGWGSREYPATEVEAFRAALKERDLAPLVIHSNYLVNLASPSRELREKSRRAVADDLERAARLGAEFVVTHSGHTMGEGLGTGLKRLGRSVRALLRDAPTGVRFLLENSAGGEAHLGGRWEHFAQLLDQLDGDLRLGVCFDTCHAHAAGYRLDTPRRVGEAIRTFADTLDLDRLGMIHLNDSQGAAGEHRDRHEHLGKGTIGDAGLRAILRRRELRDRCAIMETPIRKQGDDLRNLRHARGLRG
jgi:deoxyribonuclease-4